MTTDPKMIEELEALAQANDGILLPEAVVEQARHPKSALHGCFDWDETEAATKWRLHQARNLIRVVVKVVSVEGKKVPVRVFVSLTPDREDGGYRLMARVLANRTYREVLLQDALDELQSFQEKYKSLKELTKVFAAIQSVRRQLTA